VSVEGLDVLVLVRRVPEFDGQVGGAGDYTSRGIGD